MKRYKMGYVEDEWGMNRHMGLIEDPSGDLVKYSDFKAYRDAIKDQASSRNGNCREISREEAIEMEKEFDAKHGWNIFGDDR